jgi:hypothetical protein
MLSNTKVSHMYTPGSAPVTFAVDGVRFGCALGMEAAFPEVFLEYERLEVDCVLFSTHGPGSPVNNGPFALQSQALAAANSYWVSYAGTAQDAPNAPSGVITPNGDWITRCPPEPISAIATTDLDLTAENYARPWRRVARSGLYAQYQAPNDLEASTGPASDPMKVLPAGGIPAGNTVISRRATRRCRSGWCRCPCRPPCGRSHTGCATRSPSPACS